MRNSSLPQPRTPSSSTACPAGRSFRQSDLPGGGPAYPLAGLGVRGRAQLTDSVTLLGGVFNGSPIPRDSPNAPESNPNGVSFPLDTGTLAIAELQYAYGSGASGKANADGPLPGIYKLGAWYDSYKFDDQQTDTIGLPLASPLSNGSPGQHHGDFSLYGVADQMIWRSKDNASRSLNVFFRPMFTPYHDRNLVSASINAGFALKAPLPGRDNDDIRGRNGDRMGEQRRVGLRPANAGLPAFGLYAYPRKRDLCRGDLPVPGPALLAIQPDLQYFINPGLGIANPENPTQRIKNEFVLGLRTNVNF